MSAGSTYRTAASLVLLLVASACSDAPGGGAATTTEGGASPTVQPTTTFESVVTTTTSSVVLWVGYLTDLIDGAYAAGGTALRGRVVAVAGEEVQVEVVGLVADWSGVQAAPALGAVTLGVGPDRGWLPGALGSALGAGPLPALLLVAEGRLLDVAVLTEDLRAFRRDPGRELPDVIRGGAWVGEAIDRGGLQVETRPPVDPARSLACQDLSRRVVTEYAPVDGDEVAGAVRFAEAALAADQAEGERWELEAQALRLAENHVWFDEVTGQWHTPYIGDITDQLARGVSPEEVEVHPTTSVYLDPGRFDWLEPGGEMLLLADTETGRLLGWIDFYAHLFMDVEAEPGWLEVMVPPKGALGLYLRPLGGATPLCTESLPAPFLVIPRADLMVERWALVMDEGSAFEWSDEG